MSQYLGESIAESVRSYRFHELGDGPRERVAGVGETMKKIMIKPNGEGDDVSEIIRM